MCFAQRVEAFKKWGSAETSLQKKRENEAKVKAANKQEKFQQVFLLFLNKFKRRITI